MELYQRPVEVAEAFPMLSIHQFYHSFNAVLAEVRFVILRTSVRVLASHQRLTRHAGSGPSRWLADGTFHFLNRLLLLVVPKPPQARGRSRQRGHRPVHNTADS